MLFLALLGIEVLGYCFGTDNGLDDTDENSSDRSRCNEHCEDDTGFVAVMDGVHCRDGSARRAQAQREQGGSAECCRHYQ